MQYPAKSSQIGQQIIQALLTSSDSSTILFSIAGKMGELFKVDVCIIVSGDVNLLSPVQLGWWYGEQFSVFDEQEFTQLLSQSILLGTAPIAEPWATADRKTQPLVFLDEQLQAILSVRALLGMVTCFRGRTNGMILLGKSQPYEWTSSERDLLKNVAESVAIAISQVQLQQQAQIRSRYQTLLYHLSRKISQSSDIDSIFQLALTEIGKTLQLERCLILMLKYKDPLLSQRSRQYSPEATVQVTHHWSAATDNCESIDKYSFSLKDSNFCQEAFNKAPHPLAIAEHAPFPDVDNSKLPTSVEPNHSSALLMMPLMGNVVSEAKPVLVLGFLVLQHDRPRLWLTDELDLIGWIGIQLSTAIIHYQTINQVQSIVEERTAQLKWSLDVQAKLSEKMRQQIDQLRQLNELKDDFLSSMSHELKTPLTSMKMAIKMLRQPELSEAMREKYLNILEQEWSREYNLIKDLLTLQKVESGEFTSHPQQLNLEQTIAPLVSAFVEKWQPDKGLNLETQLSESSLNLYADPESLEHILTELLLNAGKYSDADTTVRLSANRQANANGNEVAISISNDGAGISAEELPHIFDKFRRGKGVTARAVPGTGLGLALVKYLVEHLNGAIEVASEPLDNSKVFRTTFTIKLPITATSERV
ncbi:GAF domain-containing sensor histidine kinase [Pleurocapsales cyanobacterium LEGE 06147]|nr:GAF domain-containing sensor histidine kinase [Pleurocapsales cyanobacterium LEGE 06147]